MEQEEERRKNSSKLCIGAQKLCRSAEIMRRGTEVAIWRSRKSQNPVRRGAPLICRKKIKT